MSCNLTEELSKCWDKLINCTIHLSLLALSYRIQKEKLTAAVYHLQSRMNFIEDMEQWNALTD